MSDANGHAKGPVSQFSFPLVLRLTMSPSGDVIRVAAVTVVKVEAVKEPVPSQRSTRTTVTAATRMIARWRDIVSRSTSGDEDWETGLFLFVFAYVTKTEV